MHAHGHTHIYKLEDAQHEVNWFRKSNAHTNGW